MIQRFWKTINQQTLLQLSFVDITCTFAIVEAKDDESRISHGEEGGY